MRCKKNIIFPAMMLLLPLVMGCSGNDNVAPVIHSITVPNTVYVGENVKIEVDASDNKTKKEDLRFVYHITNGTYLAKESQGIFKVEMTGQYDIEVTAYDKSGNSSSLNCTINAIDSTTGWTVDEKNLFLKYFYEILPYPYEAEGDTKTLEEYNFSSNNSTGLCYLVEGVTSDCTESYGKILERMGFVFKTKSDVTTSYDGTAYTLYHYLKHSEMETDENRYMHVQIDYFPGFKDGSVDPAFEIYISNVSQKVDVFESSSWENTLVKRGLDNSYMADVVPAYQTSNENATYTYYDRHEALGQGYLTIDIQGTTLEELENYVDLLTAAGFLGQWYNDLIEGSKSNVVIYPSDNFFLMYIYNQLDTEENKVSIVLLYDTQGASSYEE